MFSTNFGLLIPNFIRIFKSGRKFEILRVWQFFWAENYNFESKFWKFLKLFILYLKREWNCQQFAKKSSKSEHYIVLRSLKINKILHLQKSNYFRFAVKFRVGLKKWKITLEQMRFFVRNQIIHIRIFLWPLVFA